MLRNSLFSKRVIQRCYQLTHREVMRGGGQAPLSSQDELLDKYVKEHDRISYVDEYDKHKQVLPLGETYIPQISTDAYVAPCATVVGNVEVWYKTSIWNKVVIRAETNLIRIGVETNIQDGTVVEELPYRITEDHDGSTIIGHRVTIGHRCRLKACTIEDDCFVGMGSILNVGSYMEKYSMIGAGTVLEPFARVPSGQLWLGNPGRFVRNLTEEEIQNIRNSSEDYVKNGQVFAAQYYLPHHYYQQKEAEAKGFVIGHAENPVVRQENQAKREAYGKSFKKH